jgi:hypothetical protein
MPWYVPWIPQGLLISFIFGAFFVWWGIDDSFAESMQLFETITEAKARQTEFLFGFWKMVESWYDRRE